MKPIRNGSGKVLTAPQWARLWPPRNDLLESAEREKRESINDRREGVASSAPEGLKRRNVALMIVLVLVTFGLYYPIWILRTRRGLNNLNARGEVGATASVALLALYLVWAALDLGSAVLRMSGNAEQPWAALKLMATITSLPASILWLVLIFRVRYMLEEHLVRMTSDSFHLSGILTFALSIFYLQHVINTRLLGRASHTRTDGTLRRRPIDSSYRWQAVPGQGPLAGRLADQEWK